MDLSLGSSNKKDEEGNNNNNNNNNAGAGAGAGAGDGAGASSSSCSNSSRKEGAVEKEHMFDKVVTPSDVGKLNRLVIPKQYAEKYFPLDSSSNEKGLLLNFEDRNGKLWRFRYSYWNSSQSYVMTKGWSRFVKEKKLDAGDIVSFQRGLGELYRHRLYIDWRRRLNNVSHSSTSLITPLFLPNHYSLGRLHSLPPQQPQPPTSTMHPYNHHLNIYTAFHQQQYHDGEHLNLGSGSVYYLRPPPPPPSSSMSMADQQQDRVPMIIDSVPISHHHNHHHSAITAATTPSATTGKRLRLFGVNMECASSQPQEESKICLSSNVLMANSLPSSSLHQDPARFGDQRQLFDLDPSL